MAILDLQQVGVCRGEQQILSNISFSLEAGEITALVGPSGSGKTTLLRLLNLLASPTTGTVSFQGQNITSYNPMRLRRQIGYLPQKPLLFGCTVLDNLEYSYTVAGQQGDRELMTSYLARVGFAADFLDKAIAGLSGGEQQRAALIRLLLMQPQVLLLDEFTSALDDENTRKVEALLASERAARPLTVIFTTHDLAQAARLASSVIRLEQGRLQFNGAAAAYWAQYPERNHAHE